VDVFGTGQTNAFDGGRFKTRALIAENKGTDFSFRESVLQSVGINYVTLPAVGQILDVLFSQVVSKYFSGAELDAVSRDIVRMLQEEFKDQNISLLANGRLSSAGLAKLESFGTGVVAGLVLSIAENAIADHMRGKYAPLVIEETKYVMDVVGNSTLAAASLSARGVPLALAIRVGVAAGVVQASTAEVLATVTAYWDWRNYIGETDAKVAQLDKSIASNNAAILESKKVADETGDKSAYRNLLLVSNGLNNLRTRLIQSESPLSTTGSFWSAFQSNLFGQ
jgi:hypothetical protein